MFKHRIVIAGSLKAASNGNQIVALGLKCMFSVLNELNRRDPELCSEALSSLLHLIQHMPAEALSNESYASIQSMHHMLRQLRVEGLFFMNLKTFRTLCFKFNNFRSLYPTETFVLVGYGDGLSRI